MGADRGSAAEPAVRRRDSVLLIRLPLWFPRERSEPCTVRSSERFAYKKDPALSGHHRSLPLYCVIGADALSRAGNAMTTIAIPLIVLNQGYSAAEVGLSSAAASLPIVIGALAGGSFADRIGYRTTSVISDAASGVTVLVLGLLAQLHMLPLWALLALVFLSNLMDAPGSGARASQIPDLTRLADVPLTRSTGIRSTLGRLATMLGSAAAGVVVSLTSPDMALYINAVCFLISIAVTMLMVPSDAALRQEGVRDTIAPVSDGMSLRDFFAGAAFIAHTPLVRAIVIMVVLTNLLDSAAMNVLWALYARTVSSDGAWYGVMTAILAAGMPFGSVMAGYLGQSMPLPLAFAIIGGCYAGVFVLTGFGRHWRRFDESFRHATEV
ncbi:MFS transporter [Bifidobacterium pullorum]|uniref:MFS transporter n=1 Tax=Bifidobacterium pullorum TaxID=78448 RepID=UPI003119D3E0